MAFDGICQVVSLLPQLGLTNVDIFLYHRLSDPAAAAELSRSLGGLRLPCGMRLTVRQLLPNRGRDSAVFLHHILAHFESLPKAMFLVSQSGRQAGRRPGIGVSTYTTRMNFEVFTLGFWSAD